MSDETFPVVLNKLDPRIQYSNGWGIGLDPSSDVQVARLNDSTLTFAFSGSWIKVHGVARGEAETDTVGTASCTLSPSTGVASVAALEDPPIGSSSDVLCQFSDLVPTTNYILTLQATPNLGLSYIEYGTRQLENGQRTRIYPNSGKMVFSGNAGLRGDFGLIDRYGAFNFTYLGYWLHLVFHVPLPRGVQANSTTPTSYNMTFVYGTSQERILLGYSTQTTYNMTVGPYSSIPIYTEPDPQYEMRVTGPRSLNIVYAPGNGNTSDPRTYGSPLELDFVEFTYQEPEPKDTWKTIVGACVGGVLGLVTVLCVILLFIRRRHRKNVKVID